MLVERLISTSGAPLTATRNVPSANWWMVLINLRSESNGSSATRGSTFPSLRISNPLSKPN